MLIAQITDTNIKRAGHLAYQVADIATMLHTCVASIEAHDPLPDLMVLTGDLVDRVAPEEYVHLRELLVPLLPQLFMIPGSHDECHAMDLACPEPGWVRDSPFLQKVSQHGPIRVIGLDTVAPGEDRGELCGVRLA